LRIGLVQLTSGDLPPENIVATTALIRLAADQGATFVATPEVTNIVSLNRAHQQTQLHHQNDDPSLSAYVALANELGVWLLIGSLALKSDDPDGRFVNRSFLIAPTGAITVAYDKIHMFDAEISAGETYCESAGFRPGCKQSLARTAVGNIGLTICYDLRFPSLFRSLARAGAQIITVPSAFSPVTGAAHWHVLLRARAIETGCFIVAPAQCGTHAATVGKARKTFGHSLIVSPWGDIVADGGATPGVTMTDVDLNAVAEARHRIPSLSHNPVFENTP